MAITPYLIPSLLLIALVLPTIGALVARLIGRQSNRAMLVVGGLTAGGAMASVVALQFMHVDQIALGRYAIFVPARAPLIDNQTFALTRSATAQPTTTGPVALAVTLVPTIQASVTLPVVASPTASSTALPSPVAIASDTPVPATGTPSPTNTSVPTSATLTPTNTKLPTRTTVPTAKAEPTTTATNKPARRKYTVQKGDSLRSIANDFNVSVQALLDANDLSPKEGDNLQTGQKLIIPSH